MDAPLDLAELRVALDEADATWQMDENNPIVRMTEEQRRLRLGVNPPPDQPSVEEAARAAEEAPEVTIGDAIAEDNAGAPAAYDLRNVGGKKYTTPVRNQGGCGSCVAFGTVAVMETTYQRSHDRAGSGLDLSEAHLFYCHGGEEGRTCANGWFPEPAFAKAKAKGVATEDKYPYSGSQQACAVSAGWEQSKAVSLGHTHTTTRAAMKEWISTRGSLTGCFVVFQDFFSYRSGVYRHVSGEAAGGHCVEIIGYDDAQAAWICKNSWGTGWGDSGYFRIGYGQCQIETWAGPYGCTGVSLTQWTTTTINGLWSNSSPLNAWAHLQNAGWTKVANNSESTQRQLVTELVGARAGNRQVSALVDQNTITELYVL